ncbi:MAG TPA: hypothetical protein VGW97_03665 [Chthoniobacterales bacterium]|jgi:hypothetical protein|nr:hypothetical protein [Chthoniobacterales bacterium]
MKRAGVSLLFFAVATLVVAEAQNFTGEYADRNFLGGQATFQMSLEQSGNVVSVWFSAGYNDGHSIQPVADGSGRISGKGIVAFTFNDSSHNAGTGSITRAGDDIIVSLKATRVADPRCLEIYRQNIRLKHVKK